MGVKQQHLGRMTGARPSQCTLPRAVDVVQVEQRTAVVEGEQTFVVVEVEERRPVVEGEQTSVVEGTAAVVGQA